MRPGSDILALLVVGVVTLSGCVGSQAGPAAEPGATGKSVVQASGEPISDAGSIVGSVVDDSLAAIAGAQVAVLDLQLTAVTDEGGGFEFQNLAPGTYRVAAAALGYDSAAKSVNVVQGESAPVQFLLAKIAVVEEWVEILGPWSWYFECRLGTPVLTGPCGAVSLPNDKASQNFTMTDDVVDFVGELRWQPGSFATSKALRMSFSYVGRPSTHWFCTATSPTPLQWHYNLPSGLESPSDGCQTPPYCGIGASQGVSSGDHKVPTTEDSLLVYTNTPFGCATQGDPTHAVELSLQQRLEAAVTMFHGGDKPLVYTVFPDA